MNFLENRVYCESFHHQRVMEEEAKRGREGSEAEDRSGERVGSALEARSDAWEEAGDQRARTHARVDSEVLAGVLMPRCCCAPGCSRKTLDFPENLRVNDGPAERPSSQDIPRPFQSPGMARAVVLTFQASSGVRGDLCVLPSTWPLAPFGI